MNFIKSEFGHQQEILNAVEAKNHMQVIAVASGKGGVGKTNIAVNLSIALSKQNRRVLLLDADLGLSNVDVLVGIHPTINLSHVLSGQRSLQEVIIDGPAGIKVVPAASGVELLTQLSALEYAGLVSAFDELENDFDYLIIDTGSGISETVLRFICSVQEILMVVCDEPTSIIDTYALMEILRNHYSIQRFNILANKVQSSSEGRLIFSKIRKLTDKYLDLQLNYVGAVTDDKYLQKAVKQQKPVITAYPNSRSAREFARIATKIATWPARASVSSNTPFFLDRLLQQPTLF